MMGSPRRLYQKLIILRTRFVIDMTEDTSGGHDSLSVIMTVNRDVHWDDSFADPHDSDEQAAVAVTADV